MTPRDKHIAGRRGKRMAKAFDEVPWSDWFEQWHPDFGQCRVREKVLRTGERYSEFFPKP